MSIHIGTINIGEYRRAEYQCDPLFLSRWSPRAMSEQPIDRHELMTLFEAAKWAPSSFNNQPWRFVYALREKEGWRRLNGLLKPANEWASKAAVLIVVLSKRTFDYNGEPSRTHHFDAGAAWCSLALEGYFKSSERSPGTA